jgi:hypothetical protein
MEKDKGKTIKKKKDRKRMLARRKRKRGIGKGLIGMSNV